MVQVREQGHRSATGDVDLERWLAVLPTSFSSEEQETLLRAARAVIAVESQPAQDTRDWSRDMDCVAAGLDVAQILAELHVGADCLVAGILYRAVREQRLEIETLRSEFGEPVFQLLQGVLRMAAISDLKNPSSAPVLGQADGQKDNIRRMLIALVDDVRVALIKLAERTCAIRAVKDKTRCAGALSPRKSSMFTPLWLTGWVSVTSSGSWRICPFATCTPMPIEK